jgi:hypothetical protein
VGTTIINSGDQEGFGIQVYVVSVAVVLVV